MFQLPLQHLLPRQLWNERRELAPFFVIARNLMMETPGKGDKRAIQNKINNDFNFTMMASLLPEIVSKKNKQTEKNITHPMNHICQVY